MEGGRGGLHSSFIIIIVDDKRCAQLKYSICQKCFVLSTFEICKFACMVLELTHKSSLHLWHKFEKWNVAQDCTNRLNDLMCFLFIYIFCDKNTVMCGLTHDVNGNKKNHSVVVMNMCCMCMQVLHACTYGDVSFEEWLTAATATNEIPLMAVAAPRKGLILLNMGVKGDWCQRMPLSLPLRLSFKLIKKNRLYLSTPLAATMLIGSSAVNSVNAPVCMWWQ